jgi:hypothetical protein
MRDMANPRPGEPAPDPRVLRDRALSLALDLAGDIGGTSPEILTALESRLSQALARS